MFHVEQKEAWFTWAGGGAATGGGAAAGCSSFCSSAFLLGGSGGWGTTLTTQLNILRQTNTASLNRRRDFNN